MNEEDLRDCFAMFALNGYISYMGCNPKDNGKICEAGENNAEALARASYTFADAMLDARSQSDEEGIAVIKKRKYVRKN